MIPRRILRQHAAFEVLRWQSARILSIALLPTTGGRAPLERGMIVALTCITVSTSLQPHHRIRILHHSRITRPHHIAPSTARCATLTSTFSNVCSSGELFVCRASIAWTGYGFLSGWSLVEHRISRNIHHIAKPRAQHLLSVLG